MFKRLRKDRNKMILGFFFETILAIILVVALIVYEILNLEKVVAIFFVWK